MCRNVCFIKQHSQMQGRVWMVWDCACSLWNWTWITEGCVFNSTAGTDFINCGHGLCFLLVQPRVNLARFCQCIPCF